MTHYFRFLCVMAVLCYCMSGFSQISLRVGDTFTIVAPESFRHDGSTYVVKQYIWSGLDGTHFKVEYDQSHSFSYSGYRSEGVNVARVTLLQPFEGTMTLNCTVTGFRLGYGETRNQTYSYTFSCAPVDVTVYPSEFAMAVGQSQTLQWQFSPSNTQYGATVSFSSSDNSIADVDLNGKVIAKKVGTATITATTNYGTTATCEVTVVGLTLDKAEAEMHVGDQLRLAATLLPSGETQRVTWSSSDPAIARVVGGTVYALEWGECVITAKAIDNSALTSNCLIYVLPEQQQGGGCDVNGSGIVDVDDVNEVINYILAH